MLSTNYSSATALMFQILSTYNWSLEQLKALLFPLTLMVILYEDD
jgi:hypothetical protein